MPEYVKWQGAVEIPLEDLMPAPDNPNVMDDVNFNALVEMISTYGFDEPLQVTPHPDVPGKFIIAGGEHRYKAAKVLGIDKVPCCIKEQFADDLVRKTEMVRRNLVRGELDQVKFNKLIQSIQDKHQVTADTLKERMAVREDQWEKLVDSKKKSTDDKTQEVLDEVRKETQAIDGLAFILNEIFTKFGDTVQNGYLFFFYKGHMNLMIQANNELMAEVDKMVKLLKANEQGINEYLVEALKKVDGKSGPQGGVI